MTDETAAETAAEGDAIFTETEDERGEWVDVRMTNPEEGEWDVDAVIVDGRVQYVDLRVRPHLLTEFVDCLVDDVGDDRARRLLAEIAERNGVALDADAEGD
ncbi:MAG: hypothetical protein ABEJ26_02220 [Halosimplex sp.]